MRFLGGFGQRSRGRKLELRGEGRGLGMRGRELCRGVSGRLRVGERREGRLNRVMRGVAPKLEFF